VGIGARTNPEPGVPDGVYTVAPRGSTGDGPVESESSIPPTGTEVGCGYPVGPRFTDLKVVVGGCGTVEAAGSCVAAVGEPFAGVPAGAAAGGSEAAAAGGAFGAGAPAADPPPAVG